MGWLGHGMIDTTDIETRFSLEDGMSYMASIFTEPSEEDLEQIDAIRIIMESLPAREADFVDLYYFRRKKQTEIAYLFDCSQPTVCYRLQRATARIQFLLQLPHVEEADILRDMADFLTDPLDEQIMVLMWRTTCQSEVAKQLNVSQGLVRHRFLRTVKRMRNFAEIPKHLDTIKTLHRDFTAAVVPSDKMGVSNEIHNIRERICNTLRLIPDSLHGQYGRFEIYVRLFEFISSNLNILREVQRPVSETHIIRKIDRMPA